MAAVAELQRRVEVLKPPLKWAGGKRWLVPYLRGLWAGHEHRRLVEPLCGGLAATVCLRPARALLNDANPHAINFYRWLKKGLRITIPMRNEASLYYEHRERFNRLAREGKGNTARAAALFYYLNRTGYNGLCRFNSEGLFNVPFGRHKRINYLSDFSPYKDVFSRWDFTAGDFERVALEPGDFVYADPPYDVEFTQYSKHAFGWEDQARLATWLARHSGPVVLSNQATDRILKLYKELGYEITLMPAPRMISCTGDRTPASEVLATRGL
jgi:DNA adenine methylase